MTIPPETTWLDIATLVIALVGLVTAIFGFALAAWRYWRESRVNARVDVGLEPGANPTWAAVILTNTERRTVTVSRVGLTTRRTADGVIFERWRDRNVRRGGSGFPISDPALPLTMHPGSAPAWVVAGLGAIKGSFHPDTPAWAFCVDTYRNVYWGAIPEDVRAAIRAAARRRHGPMDEYGQYTTIDVPDDEEVNPSAIVD